jgi:hypothetical protein
MSIGGPLTKKQLERVHEEQMKVVARLKKLLKMPEVKDMLPEAEIRISGDLALVGGYLCYWYNDRCVMPSDCDSNHRSEWINTTPNREIVEEHSITTEDIEDVIRRLRA